MKFDLHMHTTASDGTDTPEELVRLVADRGFELIAITDHDTTSGFPAAKAAGDRLGVRVIPGVEISAGDEVEVHVLGYGMKDLDGIEETLSAMRRQRAQRMRQMVKKLNQLGVPVEMHSVFALAEDAVGRAHLARVLVEGGYVRDVREAFSRYLSQGRPAYVPREKMRVSDAIRLITAAGGLPIIAHPGQGTRGESIWSADMLKEMKSAGLGGLEAYHMSHSKSQCDYFDSAARRMGMLVTGGSDYHGKVKTVEPGDGMQFWGETKHRDLEALLRVLGG